MSLKATDVELPVSPLTLDNENDNDNDNDNEQNPYNVTLTLILSGFDELADTMADPFEVRMRFTSQLQHLNASATSAHKAAHYALKHREMDEDLHSCILEQLERNNMNNRANIMYFFEALCDLAQREQHPEFVRMMERDILRIVDLVAPEDGSGAANVKVVRKVLANLASKRYLQQQTVQELEDCIKDRDQIGGVPDVGSPIGKVGEENGRSKPANANANANANASLGLDKRQIEQRIEEDRERHKRLRENHWQVDADEEFYIMWNDLPPLCEDDYREMKEQSDERKTCAEAHYREYEGR